MRAYLQYWGKSWSNDDEYHLLPYHCLDAAAVCRVLLDTDRSLHKRLQEMLSFIQVERLLPFLIGLHDVGKFSPKFQSFAPDLYTMLQPGRSIYRKAIRALNERHHTHLGQLLWENHLQDILLDRLVAGGGEEANYAVGPLISPVMCHHGKPPNIQDDIRTDQHFETSDLDAAETFALGLCDMLCPEPLLLSAADAVSRAEKASWDLAGLCILCDWVASNTTWFQPCSDAYGLEQYFHEFALPRARKAVCEAGIIPPPASKTISWGNLFPSLSDKSPTPLQEYALAVDLPHGSQLHILEDLTGSGKTEAGLLLAARIMAADLADGFLFALPTQATANSMYKRLATLTDNLFITDQKRPSLMLAHGARSLNDMFLQSVGLDHISTKRGSPDDQAAEPVCNAWFADNRKKALLAPAGACTLDQALLGILPAKHQSLRLFGLGRNVLIADEIHAYDPYTTGLLETLLTFHAARGGSAVLLSATLPARIRDKFTKAFEEGAQPPRCSPSIRRQKEIMQDKASDTFRAYPAAWLSNVSMQSRPAKITAAPWSSREVNIEHTSSQTDVIDSLAKASRSGACCCYICNTVDDALDAYETLRNHPAVDKEKMELFHARFCLGDRLPIEERIVSRFGKTRDGESKAKKQLDRQGWIVLGTQVLEMSLDLDFDFMATDLAPMDALIQRQGRLQRHAFERPADYGETTLLVHGPPWRDDPGKGWFTDKFDKAQWVYRLHGRLWLTLRELRRRQTLRLPEDVRELVEAVYAPEADALIPPALQEHDAPHAGKDMAMYSYAGLAVLNAKQPYGEQGAFEDILEIRTRLGDETVTVRLAKVREGEVVPWIDPAGRTPHDVNRAWALSELSVRTSILKRPLPPADSDLASQVRALDESPRGKYKPTALLEERGSGWVLQGETGEKERTVLQYDRLYGLKRT